MNLSPERISRSQRNCPFGLVSQNCLLRTSSQVMSCFPFLNFVETKVSQERQSYKNMPRVCDSSGAASALLASACMPSSISHGLGHYSVWASFWRRACAPAPGYCSQSVHARVLNSAVTRALGVLGGIKLPTMIGA